MKNKKLIKFKNKKIGLVGFPKTSFKTPEILIKTRA